MKRLRSRLVIQCGRPVCLRRTNNDGGLTYRERTRGTASCGPGRRLSYCPSAMAASCALRPRLSLPLFVLFVLPLLPSSPKTPDYLPRSSPAPFLRRTAPAETRLSARRIQALFVCIAICLSIPPPPNHLAGRALTLFSRRHLHRWTLSVLRMFPVAPLSHTTRVFPRLFTAIVIAAITTARAMSWRPLGK